MCKKEHWPADVGHVRLGRGGHREGVHAARALQLHPLAREREVGREHRHEEGDEVEEACAHLQEEGDAHALLQKKTN